MRSVHLAVAVLFIGCMGNLQSPPGSGGGSTDPGSPAAVDAGAVMTMTDLDRQMMQIAMGYKSFAKISSQSYPSTIGMFQINVYATGDVKDYKAIHPEVSGSNVKVAVGTVIVREVLDATGATSKLTVLAKGPTGYDATIGDWWWGVADPTGTPLVTENVLQVGRLQNCQGCHIPRVTDDYLFGVPKIYETGGHP